jgi:GH24 family phage-related lysozyme (muramidase)
LKTTEGGIEYQTLKGSYWAQRFHAYPSPEGGSPTIGYGHKMKEGETFLSLSEKEAEELLIKDIDEAKVIAQRLVDFGKLDQWRQEMAIEFAYNLGNRFKAFKKFRAALESGDFSALAGSYKRYYTTPKGQKKELKQRNDLFLETFITPKLEK